MNDLIERLRLGDGTSPDHELLLEAADALEALAKEKALQALHDENERLGLYKDAYAEQEPIAWISTGPARMIHWTSDKPAYGDDWVPLYTTPPQRKPLRDHEIAQILDRERMKWKSPPTHEFDLAFVRAIEAAHGIKE